ncbi:hypothetical protein AWZ03_015055, partial [Drosophila navojoa]
MTKLPKKGQKWIWSEEQEEALQKLKESLTTAPILACPDFSAKFVLQSDASDYGLRAVLSRTGDSLRQSNAIEGRAELLGHRKGVPRNPLGDPKDALLPGGLQIRRGQESPGIEMAQLHRKSHGQDCSMGAR